MLVYKGHRLLFRGLAIGLIALVGVGVGGSYYLSTPQGCTTCHEMQPFYDSWRASEHSSVDCHTCHEAGVGTLVKDFTSHIKGVAAEKIEAEPPESPGNKDCTACHKSPPAPSSSQISCLRCHSISHPDHVLKIGGDYSCSTCHDNHSMTVRDSTCLGCHGAPHTSEG